MPGALTSSGARPPSTPTTRSCSTVRTRIEGHRFLVATGSRPARPEIPGLAEAGCLDASSLWSLTAVPESLVVIGAGPVGMEFAQVFARFGSKVTVLTDQGPGSST